MRELLNFQLEPMIPQFLIPMRGNELQVRDDVEIAAAVFDPHEG